MKLAIIGPPGSGKSTQAKLIARFLDVTTISPADILRAHVRSRTSLGIQVEKYIDAGAFVPDSMTNKLVRGRLSHMAVKKGFVLEGYPRTSAQASFLDDILASRENQLNIVILLTADKEELLSRMLRRASQAQRSADATDNYSNRIERYHQRKEEVIENYSTRGVLTYVDGMGAIEVVADRVLEAMRERVDESNS